MPYDIYGNSLRRGYCEVHPDVPEEYPCSECMRRYERESEPPEPEQPEPTVIDYIGFDADKFKAISETIVMAAEENNEGKFCDAVTQLLDVLNPEFVMSRLRDKAK